MNLNIKETLQRTLIVQIEILNTTKKGVFENKINEFKELVLSSGTKIIKTIEGKQDKPVSNTFVKKGKTLEIRNIVEELKIDLVIFNHDLTPSQERNLESIFKARVLDRTGLILDIFALRARSYLGKLQVELAQLTHLSTRLVRGWSHLERQRGGIGLRGGPGEKQLEVDRRLINQRIKTINKKLGKVHKQKNLNRYSRKKNKNIIVALVGYTNSGKTTLFNILTGNDQFVADQPFATLDSVTRRNKSLDLNSILFSDTVGFISELPTQLIESFKATLDELKSADLLLHVVDISDPDFIFKLEEVNILLEELNLSHIPQLRVNNKIDKIDFKNFSSNFHPEDQEIWISAKENIGLETLNKYMDHYVNKRVFVGWISLQSAVGKIRAYLYSIGCVLEEKSCTSSGLIQLHIRIEKNKLKKLLLKKSIALKDSENLIIEEAV